MIVPLLIGFFGGMISGLISAYGITLAVRKLAGRRARPFSGDCANEPLDIPLV